MDLLFQSPFQIALKRVKVFVTKMDYPVYLQIWITFHPGSFIIDLHCIVINETMIFYIPTP